MEHARTAPGEPLRIDVALGERGYPIHIGAGLLDRAGELLRPHLPGGRVLVVADATVAGLHGGRLLAALAAAGFTATMAPFPAGEPSKTLDQADRLWQACAGARIDRQDAVIGFGGGVSGDLAGFVAACWMRGVRFAQIPTTLLAMVDSSVGGKTGVNSAAGKNLIGAFKQPVAVVADPALLASMDPRAYRAGLAEVLKYGVINDAGFLAWQEAHAAGLAAGDPAAVAHAVAESCRIKAWYVAEDEFENGVRAHLNYGHTFGHALERDTGYQVYHHGEAIGIGMRMAAELARELGLLEEDALIARQDRLLAAYGLPLTHPSAAPFADATRLADHCRLDKKVANGRMRFILPRRAGAVAIDATDAVQAVACAFASAFAAADDRAAAEIALMRDDFGAARQQALAGTIAAARKQLAEAERKRAQP
jgi:3-dehydroquinate synthase